MPTPILLLLALSAFADEGLVRLSGTSWRGLQAPRPDRPEAAPAPLVSSRTVTARPTDGGVLLEAIWRLDPTVPGWYDARLAGPGVRVEKVTWMGRVPALSAEDGTSVTVWVDRPTELRLSAFVEGDPTQSPVDVDLLGAARGTVDAGAWEVWDGDRAVPRRGKNALANRGFALRGKVERSARHDTLAVAQVGIGLTVGESEVAGKAHVRYSLRQGISDGITLRVPGLGGDLSVTGTDVERWTRSGDQVVITFRSTVTTASDLDLTWTSPIGSGVESRLSIPAIGVDGAFRTEGSLQLARDGEIEVLPEVSAQPIASSELPEWGRGLVAGTPTAAYASANAVSGSLSLLRFVPADSPAVLVDVAQHTIAVTEEGRSISRTYLTVRNERASHLRLHPPPGSRIFGVRVSGEVVVPAIEGDGTWLVPLKRSVETAKGLLSFPVEISALGTLGEAWKNREHRAVPLISVDAQVAVSRVTVHLPPAWKDTGNAREQRDRVLEFNEGQGITYGLSGGEEEVAAADQLFQEAVASWMQNDFTATTAKLDALKEMGADNENIARLRSNIDVVEGKTESAVETVAERRVKDEVRSRAAQDYRDYKSKLEEADRKQLAGDYAGASSGYSSAAEIGDKLAKIEQKESREQRADNAMTAKKLAESRKRAEKPADQTVSYERSTGIDFDDAEISGELEKPKVTVRASKIVIMNGRESLLVGKPEEANDDGRQIDGFIPADPNVDAPALMPEPAPEPVAVSDREFEPGDREFEPSEFGPEATGYDVFGTWGEGQGAYGFGMRGSGVGGGGSAMGMGSIGVVGGVSRGAARSAAVETRDFHSAVQSVAGVARRTVITRQSAGKTKGKRGKKGSKGQPPDTVDFGAIIGEPLDAGLPEVYASALSVVVPALGETVRFQHLLLPAGEAYAVPLDVKRTRSE